MSSVGLCTGQFPGDPMCGTRRRSSPAVPTLRYGCQPRRLGISVRGVAGGWSRHRVPSPCHGRDQVRFLSRTVGLRGLQAGFDEEPRLVPACRPWFLSKVVATPAIGDGSVDLPPGPGCRPGTQAVEQGARGHRCRNAGGESPQATVILPLSPVILPLSPVILPLGGISRHAEMHWVRTLRHLTGSRLSPG